MNTGPGRIPHLRQDAHTQRGHKNFCLVSLHPAPEKSTELNDWSPCDEITPSNGCPKLRSQCTLTRSRKAAAAKDCDRNASDPDLCPLCKCCVAFWGASRGRAGRGGCCRRCPVAGPGGCCRRCPVSWW